MPEILTVKELAALLKMNVRQIYSMMETRTREKSAHPLPFIRVNGNLRFSKVAVTEWLQTLQESAR
jgi:predicted DNA-binding transcriptional regulator AlpA